LRRHEALLSPLTRHLARRGVAPDAITLMALPPALAAGVAVAAGAFWLAAAFLALSGLFDLLDGSLARSSGQESRFGALLDSTLDRLCDAFVPMGLVVFYAAHPLLSVIPVAALITGFVISYIRARAQSLEIVLPRLWMRREDRFALTLVSLLLAPIDWPVLGIAAPSVLLVQALLAVLGGLASLAALRAAARITRQPRGAMTTSANSPDETAPNMRNSGT
jgi:CDP-diacylglycerol--glycerol-3-phosphate 3-phosphatidyltransferase